MTLNQVIDRIKTICLSHLQIRSFYQGLVTDFLTDKTTKYAGTFLQDNGGKISTSGHATTLSFRLFFLDLVHVSEESKQNEQDVQSDMVSIAMDIVAQMNNGQFNDWAISTDNNLQLLVEEYDDMVAGCVIDFSVRFMFQQNICQVPSSLANYSPTNNDMKLVYDIVYVATGAEDVTLNIPEIIGKKILLIIRDGATLYKVSNSPNNVEFTWNDSSVGLGLSTAAGQRFLILYRNY